jgi:hypothetical protein
MRYAKPGPRRLNTRTRGGNWQGHHYLSYVEHDQCVRHMIDARPEAYDRQLRGVRLLDNVANYNSARNHILFARAKQR